MASTGTRHTYDMHRHVAKMILCIILIKQTNKQTKQIFEKGKRWCYVRSSKDACWASRVQCGGPV